MPNIPDAEDVKAYGLSVSVDFNNRDMTKSLDNDEMRAVIQDSIRYNERELYDFLNGTFKEE